MLFKTKEASKYEHHFRKALDAIMQSNAPSSHKVAAGEAYEKTVVEMSSRLTRTAGLAIGRLCQGAVHGCLIRLSSRLMNKASEQERFNTCAHEFAHIAKTISGCKQSAHGPTWRSIIKAMGGNGSRCHRISRPAPNPGATPLDFHPGQKVIFEGNEGTVVRRKVKFVLVEYTDGQRYSIRSEYLEPVADKVASAARGCMATAKPEPTATPRRSRVNNPATIEGVPADEFCHRAAKKNGGTMSWAQIELKHGLHKANGMTAYRLAQKYRKRAGL